MKKFQAPKEYTKDEIHSAIYDLRHLSEDKQGHYCQDHILADMLEGLMEKAGLEPITYSIAYDPKATLIAPEIEARLTSGRAVTLAKLVAEGQAMGAYDTDKLDDEGIS